MGRGSPSIDSIAALYLSLSDDSQNKKQAELILYLRNWFTTLSTFDPITGDALPTSFNEIIEAVLSETEKFGLKGEIKDRVFHTASHTKEAIKQIIDHTRNNIIREHAMLPIHAAREVDSVSVQWLSRKPGRTLRQKLSGKPYIKAVRRRESVDTSENRLFKAFLIRFEQILIERQAALNVMNEATCEGLLALIQRWLRYDAVEEIGSWGNLPPNNSLLQDKRYRKAWDAWIWLQRLDESIETDYKRINQDTLCFIYWNALSLLNKTGRFRTVQQPIELDYDNFMVTPSLPVTGYFFPVSNSKITGKIKNIIYEKKTGLLTDDTGRDLFFYKSSLSSGLEIDSLKAGDYVWFETGHNRQGIYADKIHIVPDPEVINLELSCDKMEVSLGEINVSIQIDSECITLIQNPKCIELKLFTFNDIPEAILFLLTNESAPSFPMVTNQKYLVQTDMSVVDLCSIRPIFANNLGSQDLLPFRLLLQYWPMDATGNAEVDCGGATAIAFRSDIETVSMRSLFSYRSNLSGAVKSNASMFFMKKLSRFLPSNRLSYLVPDWGNDFELEGIRKSVNFYFIESAPLPRSIAAIFAWQSSKNFKHDKVRENDFVLVVDVFDDGISITPVQATYQKELNENVPESKGISWERHPTLVIGNNNIHTTMVQNLTQDGCQISAELIEIFGFDGLKSDAGSLSFVNNDDWYHLPNSIRQILVQNSDENTLPSKDISNCLNLTSNNYEGLNVFILPHEDTIKVSPVDRWKLINGTFSLVEGGHTLDKWQESAGDIALWRDHLPELSIKIPRDGRYENFYLVKDATVTPQRGRTVVIPVKESFTLPAGQPHYSFPLLQGKGSQELQFNAYLKSSSFPLERRIACKLQMTYTYGADDPYELKFIPFDTSCSEFKSIRVEWRSVAGNATIDISNLPVPGFPEPLGWSDFYKFRSKQGNLMDLYSEIDMLSSYVENIANYVFFAEGLVDRNLSSLSLGIVKEVAERDVDGKKNVRGRISYNNRTIQFWWGPKDIHEGDEVSFEIKKKGSNINANKVSKGRIPSRFPNRLKNELALHLKRIMGGHSLSDPLCPTELQTLIQLISTNLLDVILHTKDKSLLDAAYLVFGCMNKHCPNEIGRNIARLIYEDIGIYWEHVAYAIGDALLTWQKDIFNIIINEAKSKESCSIALLILSIAFWRSKELVFQLTAIELNILSHNLYDCLEVDLQNIEDRNEHYKIDPLCKHLELLLALMRTRVGEDENTKLVLSPDKELTKKYVTLVDDISKVVMDSDMGLKSRIGLHIVKPEMFAKTPDLLYALRMYLTGDSGASTITITSISDDD